MERPLAADNEAARAPIMEALDAAPMLPGTKKALIDLIEWQEAEIKSLATENTGMEHLLHEAAAGAGEVNRELKENREEIARLMASPADDGSV